jgi:16S rRNA processing protein RimM
LKFRGIDTISEAEDLGGATLCVPMSERVAPPEGEVFESDLIGCRVIDRSAGRELGQVESVEQTGAAVVLEVNTGLLIPFARSICVEVDTAAKQIIVDLPEGLEDLNSSRG